jgi:hypothetical protein
LASRRRAEEHSELYLGKGGGVLAEALQKVHTGYLTSR